MWREEERLWDVSSMLYKNRDEKAKSTKALMERYSMSKHIKTLEKLQKSSYKLNIFFLETDVERKINTLRRYYSKELAKLVKKSGAGRDKVYEFK